MTLDQKSRFRSALSVKWSVVLLCMAALVIYSFKASGVSLTALVKGAPDSLKLVKEMWPPNFYSWETIGSLILETIAIALWGTVIGLAISFPLAFLAAKNTAPHIIVYWVVKSFIAVLRAIPVFVYALIFVSTFGLDALPGILTIALGTIGLLAKFFAEAIESIDKGPIEALAAAGASPIAIIRHGYIPQLLSLFSGYVLYLFDHNIRVVMAIGIVGAGGLGVELFKKMRTFRYPDAMAIFIVIFLVVTLLDRLSLYIRTNIVEGISREKRVAIWGNRVFTAVLLALSLYLLRKFPVDLKMLTFGLPQLVEMVKSMFPPDFAEINRYMKLMWETIAIGVTGTVLAILISIPLGALAARNIIKNRVVSFVVKEVVNFLRAMSDVTFALVFVAAVGLGPFAGAIALALHTAGFLAKFYAEASESLEPESQEAIEATGAGFLQVVRHAVFPQILPLFNSYNLYILDRNIRASTVLGLVGAGGIGFELTMAVRLFSYKQVSAIVIVIVVTVLIVDIISEKIRSKIV